MIRLIIPDKVTALTAAQAMTAALLARQRTGQGQHVRLAMLDAVVAFIWPEGMAAYTFVGTRVCHRAPPGTRDLIFETTDGYITAAANSDSEWAGTRARARPSRMDRRSALQASGRPYPQRRRAPRADRRDHPHTKTSAEWLAAFDATEVPCAPIQTRADLLTDPQVAANQLIVESEHPHAGPMRQPRPAARFEATPAALAAFAPTLGEHTDAILEEAGIATADRAALRASGIIG